MIVTVADEDLGEFIDNDHVARSAELYQPRISRDLLLFEFGQDRFAVEASCVEGVVPWKTPVRIPGADRRARGVIQDRGRIVVLMAHPAGLEQPGILADCKRIIVCNTPRGHIGLPASATSSVGSVELIAIPTPLSVHDSQLGAFTFLDPAGYGLTQ